MPYSETTRAHGAPAGENTATQADCQPVWLSSVSITRLLAGERLPRPVIESPELLDQQIDELGLCTDGLQIWLSLDLSPIDLPRLRDSLNGRAQRMLPHLELSPAISSTNTKLMSLGADAAGRLLFTEYQFGGRGRRGRPWLSPVGRNLCFSMGLKIPGSIERLGGLSLVVGLAVADALISAGVPGVQLKWPNDLIIMASGGNYAKLGGILVEIQAHDGFCVAVIGIGLNYGGAEISRRMLDVDLADISELNSNTERTEVLAAVVNALGDYLENFLESGFAPMRAAWESLHAFHQQMVVVSAGIEASGGHRVGRVVGVSESGRLVLQGSDGRRQEIDAGEVSLRPQSGDSS